MGATTTKKEQVPVLSSKNSGLNLFRSFVDGIEYYKEATDLQNRLTKISHGVSSDSSVYYLQRDMLERFDCASDSLRHSRREIVRVALELRCIRRNLNGGDTPCIGGEGIHTGKISDVKYGFGSAEEVTSAIRQFLIIARTLKNAEAAAESESVGAYVLPNRDFFSPVPSYDNPELERLHSEFVETHGNITSDVEKAELLTKFIHGTFKYNFSFFEEETLRALVEDFHKISAQSNDADFISRCKKVIQEMHRVLREGKSYENLPHEGCELVESLEERMRKRDGVCRHTAQILCMLLTMEGIEAKTICGYHAIGIDGKEKFLEYGKARGRIPDDKYNHGSHMWVKIYVNGSYYFSDPTYGIFRKYPNRKLDEVDIGKLSEFVNVLGSEVPYISAIRGREVNLCIVDAENKIKSCNLPYIYIMDYKNNIFRAANNILQAAEQHIRTAYHLFSIQKRNYPKVVFIGSDTAAMMEEMLDILIQQTKVLNIYQSNFQHYDTLSHLNAARELVIMEGRDPKVVLIELAKEVIDKAILYNLFIPEILKDLEDAFGYYPEIKAAARA